MVDEKTILKVSTLYAATNINIVVGEKFNNTTITKICRDFDDDTGCVELDIYDVNGLFAKLLVYPPLQIIYYQNPKPATRPKKTSKKPQLT